MKMENVFVAFDQMSNDEIETFLLWSDKKIKSIKIGLELYLKYGPELIFRLREQHDIKIFLDLKLHDIPITVEKAIQSLSKLPVDFLTIHLSGGKNMANHAMNAQKNFMPKTKLLGVSYLTSLSTNDTLDIFGIALNHEAFFKMFKIAHDTNLHGVVCSPNEVEIVKNISKNIITVTPGVRFKTEIESNSNIEDQKRIMSIEDAFKNGSDYIVMGRSLTRSKNKDELLEKISLIESI